MMMSKKTGPWLLFLLLGLSVQVQGQSNRSDASRYAGTYTFSFMFGGESITLNADGTFVRGEGGCTASTEQSGTYQLAGGQLRFTVLKYIGKNNGDDSKEFDLFDPQARRQFNHSSEEEDKPAEKDDPPPKREFSLYPIEWGERFYLIDEHRLEEFAHAINLGWEPRDSSPQLTFYGIFLLREGDEEKQPSGKPSLPEKYQSLILTAPITATIVSIQPGAKEDDNQIATIDKGRLAGVRVGLRFIKAGQERETVREGVVISVEDTSAKVEMRDRLVGETLTTRFERKP